MQYTVLQGPKVLVPVDDDSIAKVVQDLLPRRDEARVASSQDVLKGELRELDKGRILWSTGRGGGLGCWIVVYEDVHGKRRRHTAGLRIPQYSLAGEELTIEEQLEAGRQTLIKARRDWNRLDASEDERYDFF